MKLKGSEAIVKVLLEQGVDTVFGYPGGAVIPLYDALYDAPLKNVLTAHEQGAIHAADGYARASGRTGVCIVTSGPGATNIVTGLATAYLDSIPLVAITGQVGVSMLGRDSFQEIDIVGVTMPITKYNMLVRSKEELLPHCARHLPWHRRADRDLCWWIFPAAYRLRSWNGASRRQLLQRKSCHRQQRSSCSRQLRC